jgi:hypothetical protein
VNTDKPLDQLEARLAELRSERAELAHTRTREEVRKLAQEWLAAACARMNGTAGLVLNGHANPEQVLGVISEYLLDSPALLDFIVEKVETTTDLTNRGRAAKLKKLDEQIAKLEQEQLRHAKAAALAEVERQFAGEAA